MGVGFYVAAFALCLLGIREDNAESRAYSIAITVLTGWGVVFSGWLTYLELFVINAICIWCVTSAIIVLIMFLVSLADLRDHPTVA